MITEVSFEHLQILIKLLKPGISRRFKVVCRGDGTETFNMNGKFGDAFLEEVPFDTWYELDKLGLVCFEMVRDYEITNGVAYDVWCEPAYAAYELVEAYNFNK